MLKFAIIATRGRAERVFGPFNTHEDAERAEAFLAANTSIVFVSDLAPGAVLHSPPKE